jgi:hypothetical protein
MTENFTKRITTPTPYVEKLTYGTAFAVILMNIIYHVLAKMNNVFCTGIFITSVYCYIIKDL